MILLDANLLIYAYDSESPFHEKARLWLEESLDGTSPVAFAWLALLAFLRICTSPRPLRHPYSMDEVSDRLTELLEHPNALLLHPADRHWGILQRLLVEGQATGNLVMDAHLAALAIEHGALLCTTDRDFARFPGLRWENPLQKTT